MRFNSVRTAILYLLVCGVFASVSRAQVPVFEINHADSTVKFNVSSSVPIAGTFDKWDATMKFTSPELTTAVLDIKIQADSVSTGSGMKDGKLKSKDFFNAKDDPYITFHSTKVTQTDPTTVQFEGDFTIRGVKKIKIADRVEVSVDLKGKRVSGPPVVFKE
jgi:polyisoprenoid-binding protein YceI